MAGSPMGGTRKRVQCVRGAQTGVSCWHTLMLEWAPPNDQVLLRGDRTALPPRTIPPSPRLQQPALDRTHHCFVLPTVALPLAAMSRAARRAHRSSAHGATSKPVTHAAHTTRGMSTLGSGMSPRHVDHDL